MRRVTLLSATLGAALTLAGSILPTLASEEEEDTRQAFSNVHFLGDSLTDIGNGPESLTVAGDSSDTGVFSNLYVPISNPVDVQSDRILPGISLAFPPSYEQTSSEFRMTLPEQLQLCSDAMGCVDRTDRSLNWVSYFVYNGVFEGLIAPGADLRPWVVQQEDALGGRATLNQSVNYAFYAAVSGSGCTNFDQDPKPCNLPGLAISDSILAAQAIYRADQSPTDGIGNRMKRDGVIVPALSTQVDLFTQDIVNDMVAVDEQTLVMVYSGANDIGTAFFAWAGGDSSFADLLYQLTVAIPNEVAGKLARDSSVNRLLDAGVENIAVLGQFNLALLPRFLTATGAETLLEKQLLSAVFGQLVALYNESLKLRVESYKDERITFVDLQTPVRDVVNELLIGLREGYITTIGERCNNATLDKVEQGSAVSCFKRRDVKTPIAFWNDSHPTTQINQVIAAAVLDTYAGRPGPVSTPGPFDEFASKLSTSELEKELAYWFRDEGSEE